MTMTTVCQLIKKEIIDFDAVCYDKYDKQHRQQAESRKKNRK
ncbi:MAG: hypothetical protein V8R64_15310 [Thomasclavelia sp.]